MKKRLIALLCAVALTLPLCVIPTGANNSLFFLSLNDTLAPQSVQTTPVQHSGWIYVPVTVFNSRVTGINFGVYYGFTNNNESLIFYNLSGKNLTFDLVNGTATAVGSDPPVPDKVLWSNGTCYVPAYALCRYFGLTYSFYTTDYGPLLRIKDSSAVLSDSMFLSSAASMMRSRYNSAFPAQPEQTTPTTPEVQQPEVTPEEPAPKFSLYLGLRATGDITPALNALANVNAAAVVFFHAESVVQDRDQIRQAAGRGHKVGIIPSGDTDQDKLDSVRQAADQLARILRQETWFVLDDSQTLAEAGYLCWTPTHSANVNGSATQLYDAIVDRGENNSGLRVLLDTRITGSITAGVLNQLREDGDTFLYPKETRY